MSATADVRVYLFTYRRHGLLPRALDSLLRQTHRNWVCELHNDDPDDELPGRLAAEINDPRITYVRHPRNLGPTGSFNLAFRPVAEPFVSVLEDDNWWEPTLLARLLSAIDGRRDVTLAWGNSWIWHETGAGEWERGGTIWPVDAAESETLFTPPDPRQACRALHSHGAMVLRVSADTMRPCPPSMPIFAIEPVRERAYPGSFLLVREPLANFAVTRSSWRSETADENMQVLVLLASTLLAGAAYSHDFYRRMWIECRGARGHQQRALVAGALLARRLGRVIRGATPMDLAVVVGWAVRYPRRFMKLVAARRRFPELAAFLESAGRARLAEWRERPSTEEPR